MEIFSLVYFFSADSSAEELQSQQPQGEQRCEDIISTRFITYLSNQFSWSYFIWILFLI